MPRNELAPDSQYYVPKFRRMELKYFCLQYPMWEHEYKMWLDTKHGSSVIIVGKHSSEYKDMVTRIAEKRESLRSKINLVRNTLSEVIPLDDGLYNPMLTAVTTDKSYEDLNRYCDLTCGRNQYYKYLRQFYWLLDKKKR